MTDFEAFGYSEGPVDIAERSLVVTVDFEAFTPEMIPLWTEAMRYWADVSERKGLRTCFFIGLESVATLRAEDKPAYGHFKDAWRTLNKVGSVVHAHNHYVFDPATGNRPSFEVNNEASTHYTKRRSMFHDAVHRLGLDFGEWLITLRRSYLDFLEDCGCDAPAQFAFRAGGWDYGSSSADLKHYLDGLHVGGFAIDSSACRGVFDTPSWRIGADFGSNVFRLPKGLVEIAACWSLDCGADISTFWRSLLGLRTLGVPLGRKKPGVFVVVLHFDHLFHEHSGPTLSYFAVKDAARVRRRIDRLFRLLGQVQSVFRLRSATFDDALSAGENPG